MIFEYEFVPCLPPVYHGRTPTVAVMHFAAALRARPGEWARWPRHLTRGTVRTSVRSRISPAARVHLPADEFEVRLRTGAAYARYVGKPVDELMVDAAEDYAYDRERDRRTGVSD